MLDLRPQILQALGSAFSLWYGEDKKGRVRYQCSHIIHQTSSMLYVIEQGLPDDKDEHLLYTNPTRKRIQKIRNALEKLASDYVGWENKHYEYPSLVKNPLDRTDEITKMVLDGGFID